MNFLQTLLEVELRQQEINKFDGIVTQIVNRIGEDIGFETGFPTNLWLAGIFRDSANTVFNSISSYKRWLANFKEENGEDVKPDFTDEEIRESMSAAAQQGRRVILAYVVMSKHGFVKRSDTSSTGYSFVKSDLMSRFRAYLTDEKNTEKFNSDLSKVVNSANEQANLEWAENLPPKQQEFIEIYKRLSIEAFRLLGHVAKVHKEKGHAEANTILFNKIESGSPDALTLREVGLVKDNGNVNFPKIIDLLDFLESPPGIAPNQVAQTLSTFNKELAYMVKRKEADRALTQNKLDQRIGGEGYTDTDKRIKEIMDSMSDAEINAAIRFAEGGASDSDIVQLKSIKLLDSAGEPTEIGNAVIKILKATGGDPNKLTDRLSLMSRMNKHDRRLQRGVNQSVAARNLYGDLKKNVKFGRS